MPVTSAVLRMFAQLGANFRIPGFSGNIQGSVELTRESSCVNGDRPGSVSVLAAPPKFRGNSTDMIRTSIKDEQA